MLQRLIALSLLIIIFGDINKTSADFGEPPSSITLEQEIKLNIKGGDKIISKINKVAISLSQNKKEVLGKKINILLNKLNQKKKHTAKEEKILLILEYLQLQITPNLQTMPKEENIQNSPLEKGDIVATIKTTNGTMKIKLFQEKAPYTVNNFIALAQQGYYDGIIFHRVIKGFMIQGGDPTGTGMGGESIYGEKFNDEFDNSLSNTKYSISMANAGPNTNGSQFFINQADNDFLNNKHSVFGQVIDGMENVDKIVKAKTAGQDKPKKDIKIISILIQKQGKSKLKDYTLDKEEAISNYKKSLKKTLKSKKNKKLESGDTVSVHYTLTLKDGTKVDSSLDRGQAFTFTLGAGQVIKGWDKGLIGHKIGDKFTLEVKPKDGYGEYDDKKVQILPREQLKSFEDNGIELKTGNKLPTQHGNFTIKKADKKEITIDINHELAGKELFFDIEVIDIK